MRNWKDLEGSGHDLTELLYQHLPQGHKKAMQQSSASMAGVPFKIRTEHLPNIIQDCYCYGNPSATHFTVAGRYIV
jgi:hypothetical protein